MSYDWINDFLKFEENEPVNKLAYTDLDMDYKCKIIKKMQEIGMSVLIDDIGNICGEIGKANNNGKTIIIGSHTDSVPNGGQYDGTVGVLAGLKAIENLTSKTNNINGKFKVIIYACEESSRYNIAYLGSKYLAGKIDKNTISEIKDKQGIRLNYAIEDARFFIRNNQTKYNLAKIDRVDKVLEPDESDYAFEVHIEQYDSLSNEKFDVGIVDSIVAPLRMNINIKGKRGHTGATPMDKRQDAVVAGALFIYNMNEYAKDEKNNIRATIPYFETKDWSANVISDSVEMFLDIRMQYPNNPKDVQDNVQKIIKDIEKTTNTLFQTEILVSDEPVKTSHELNNRLERISKQIELKYKILHSWAGHDIANVPSKNKSLIFIPSTGGSHNKDENTKKKDFDNGVLLLENILEDLIRS